MDEVNDVAPEKKQFVHEILLQQNLKYCCNKTFPLSRSIERWVWEFKVEMLIIIALLFTLSSVFDSSASMPHL